MYSYRDAARALVPATDAGGEAKNRKDTTHLEARRSRHGVSRIEEIRIDDGEFLLVQHDGVLLRLEGAARRTAASKFQRLGLLRRRRRIIVVVVVGGTGGKIAPKDFFRGRRGGGGEGDELARFTGRVGAGGYRRNVCGKSKNGTYEPHPRAPPPQNSETHSLTCAIPSSLSIDSPQWNLSDFGRRRGPCIRRESHSLIVEFGTTAAVTLIGPAGGGAELGVMYSMVVFCDDAS